MPRTFRLLIAVSLLALSSLACKAIMGGGQPIAPGLPTEEATQVFEVIPTKEEDEPSIPEMPTFTTGEEVKTDLPMPEDATQKMDLGSGLITYQTKLSLEELQDFYEKEFKELGFKKNDTMPSMVTKELFTLFYDHTNGKLIVISAVVTGDFVTVTMQVQDQ